MIGTGAVVYASVPHTFATGDTLQAADLNGNFTALDQRLAALETANATALPVLTAASGTQVQLVPNTDGAYSGTFLDVPAGTWLVQGQASLFTQVAADDVRLGLYNDSGVAIIAGSLSPVTTTSAVNAAVAVQTPPVVVTVTATTRLRLYGYRHGSSTLFFGTPTGLRADFTPDTQRLTAIKLLH